MAFMLNIFFCSNLYIFLETSLNFTEMNHINIKVKYQISLHLFNPKHIPIPLYIVEYHILFILERWCCWKPRSKVREGDFLHESSAQFPRVKKLTRRRNSACWIFVNYLSTYLLRLSSVLTVYWSNCKVRLPSVSKSISKCLSVQVISCKV